MGPVDESKRDELITAPAPATAADLLAPPVKKASAADRIRDAVRGKPFEALPEVLVGDVLALVAAVPDEKQTATTLILAKAAAEAVRGMKPGLAAIRTFHPQAGDLASLLETAGVLAQ